MNFFFRALYEIQEFTLLSFRTVRSLFRKPRYFEDILRQMEMIGTGSVFIIMLTGFFTGGVLALQSAKSLKSFGAVNLTGQLVSLSLVRELGPVLTALMVAGRVAAGIASQIGSMVVTQQIDAMRGLGTDPIKKLVAPRMIATTTMLPLLTVVADLFGLVGGWIVSFYTLRLNSALYWNTAMRSLSYNDALEGLLKPIVFGFIIGMIGCYFGINTTGGTRGVGRSTTQAVVTASILVIIADFFVSKVVLEFRY
jgi:phospholipid/cholesterol/gamma-HCH transport system permease protein